MSNRKRGRITVQSQPSKETRMFEKLASLPFLVISGFFVILGVVEIIPIFGLFGIVWTLTAASFFVIAIINLIKKNGLSHTVGYDVETDLDRSIVGLMEEVDHGFDRPAGDSTEVRLQKLRSLYEQRLITQEEYDAKRKEILEEL